LGLALNPIPYWHVAAPPAPSLDKPLPARVDVAVVGGGFTGLSAALTLARRARSVLVFDAGTDGWNASTRNGGHFGHNRAVFSVIKNRFGLKRALDFFREDLDALAFTSQLITDEALECQLERRGRFIAAWKHSHYDGLARDVDVLTRETSFESYMVGREGARKELNTDQYVGGEIRPNEGSLHPALFVQGLRERVREAGAVVASDTRVENIQPDGKEFIVATNRGTVIARDVLIATNALIGDLVPYLQRRIVPIYGAIIVTEPISPELMRSVIPQMRACIDTRVLVRHIRPTPDGTRILFGARPAFALFENDPGRMAAILKRKMVEMFPQLKSVGVEYSWRGPLGSNFTKLPMIGVYQGMHHAVAHGYGVATAAFYGHKTALKILRANDAKTQLDDMPSETRWYFRKKPWFMPAAYVYFRTKEMFDR
jgi:glycine/D-amino acid oxidase-like deaminating enzyme